MLVPGGKRPKKADGAQAKATLLQWVSDRHDPYSDVARSVPGPTLQLLQAPGWAETFGRIILLCNRDSEPRARELAAEIERLGLCLGLPVEIRSLEIRDVTDLNALHAATGRELGRAAAGGAPLVIHLSPGPPLAQTLWYMMVASGELSARLVKTVPPRFQEGGSSVVEIRPQDLALVRSRLRLLRIGPAPDVIAPIAVDRAMKRVLEQARRFAASRIPILLVGETGTGKEVLARYIHAHSGRDPSRFVPFNCAEADRSLIDSEVFGYVKGAFTGANEDRSGLVDSAAGGTLFLDEAGEAPSSLQAKLLRFLESGEYRPVGAAEARGADVRLICAIQPAGLPQLRSDFRYRIEGVRIEIPPLRERKRDIPELARAILLEAAEQEGILAPRLSDEAARALSKYAWPGNVRELKQAIRRAVILAGGDEIRCEHLPEAVAVEPAISVDLRDPSADHRAIRAKVKAALEQSRSVAGAARLLRISEPTLRSHMRRFGIARPKP